MVTSITRQQQRRDTSARWAEFNPVLLAGELGYDTTLDRMKAGDGVTQWSGLTFLDEAAGAEASAAAAAASASAATEAAAAAAESAAEATAFNTPAIQIVAPGPGDEYQVVSDDLTTYSLLQGGSGQNLTPLNDGLLVCTVSCVILAPAGGLVGAAAKTAGGPIPDNLGVFTYVRTSVPTAVTVIVALPVAGSTPVEVVPCISGPHGEIFGNVGPASNTDTGGGEPLAGYGPLIISIQQT